MLGCVWKASETMDIFLPRKLEDFVKSEVEAGRYNSSSEVVAEALRLLSTQPVSLASQLEDFDRELQRRIAAADAGEFVDPAVVRAMLERRSAERRKKSA